MKVNVGDGVKVGVSVGVNVGVIVHVGDGVMVGVKVNVGDGVKAGVSVAVWVGTGVEVAVTRQVFSSPGEPWMDVPLLLVCDPPVLLTHQPPRVTRDWEILTPVPASQPPVKSATAISPTAPGSWMRIRSPELFSGML